MDFRHNQSLDDPERLRSAQAQNSSETSPRSAHNRHFAILPEQSSTSGFSEALQQRVQNLESRLDTANQELRQIKQGKKAQKWKRFCISPPRMYDGRWVGTVYTATRTTPGRYEHRLVEREPGIGDRLKDAWDVATGRSNAIPVEHGEVPGAFQRATIHEDQDNEALQRRWQDLESRLNAANQELRQIKQGKKAQKLERFCISPPRMYDGRWVGTVYMATRTTPGRYEHRLVEKEPGIGDRLKDAWSVATGRSNAIPKERHQDI